MVWTNAFDACVTKIMNFWKLKSMCYCRVIEWFYMRNDLEQDQYHKSLYMVLSWTIKERIMSLRLSLKQYKTSKMSP